MTSVSVTHAEAAHWTERRWTVRPAHVLVGALCLFTLGNVGRIPLLDLGARQAPILLNDLAIGAVIVAGFIAMAGARSMKLNDVAMLAITFAAVGGLSAIGSLQKYGLSWFETLASLAYLARWCAYFGVYLVVINCLRVTDIDRTWGTVERVIFVMVVFGLIQAAFLPNFATMVFPPETAAGMEGWDQQGNRLVSTILDPNIMAGLINVVLLVQLSRMAFGVRVPLWQPLLLVAALLVTLSRGGLLAFGTGAIVILVVRGPTRRMVRLAAMSAIGVAAALPFFVVFAKQYGRFSVTDGSAMARVMSWSRALEVFAENPWFGVGFNTYGFVQDHRGYERLSAQSYSADGGLLFIAVMTGLVGLAIYLAMLWCVMRRCKWGWEQRSASSAERGLLLGVFAATAATLVHTIFVNTLLIVFMMELLWIMWGLSFILTVEMKRRSPLLTGA